MKALAVIPWIRVIPSQANYFLCEIIEKYTATQLTEKLLKYNILIKNCSSKIAFKNRNYIRIAVRNEFENNTLLNALMEI